MNIKLIRILPNLLKLKIKQKMYKNNFLCTLPWREYLFIADIPNQYKIIAILRTRTYFTS